MTHATSQPSTPVLGERSWNSPAVCVSRRFSGYSRHSCNRTRCVIFKLTREGAARWLSEARLYRLAGIFLFEFVVVLLGVLAAQEVADWADDRRLAREAGVQFQQAREQAIRNAGVQKYWATVAPCLIERAREVARLAANGETMSAAEIGRPALPMTRMPSWDEDVRRAAIARFGSARMDAIANFEVNVEIARETTIGTRDNWATFALLDPANGTPSDVDRGNVRLAAIKVSDYIRLMRYNDPVADMDALEVPRAEWENVGIGNTPVDRCGFIRDWQ